MQQPRLSTAALLKLILISLNRSSKLVNMARPIGGYGIVSDTLKHHIENQFNINLGDRRFCFQAGANIVAIIDKAIAVQHMPLDQSEEIASPVSQVEAMAASRKGKSFVDAWLRNFGCPVNKDESKINGFKADVLIMDDLPARPDYTATQIGLAKDKQIKDIMRDCFKEIHQDQVPPALFKGVLQILQAKGYLPPVISNF